MKTEEIQAKVLTLIEVFDRICMANNIFYTLTSGSVLGAVRHKGFIPWDTDMDVFVKIRDFELMREIVTDNLPNNLKLYMWDKEENYGLPFDRLAYKDIPHEVVHLDIFPLIGAPDSMIKKKYFTKICFYSYNFLKCKYTNTEYSQPKNKKKIEIIKFILKPLPGKLIKKWYRWLENLYDFDTASYVYTIASGYGLKECLPKDMILSTTKMQFENLKLPVPTKYHEYLTTVYGDYMVPKRDGYKMDYKISLKR